MHQALLSFITIPFVLFHRQRIVVVLLCSDAPGAAPPHTHTSPFHCWCHTTIPSGHCCLFLPLPESGRHPLSRCGGVQAVGLAWKSIMRDRAENSYYCSTVCILLWSDAPGAAPPPHTTYHWQPRGGFTTAIASPVNR